MKESISWHLCLIRLLKGLQNCVRESHAYILKSMGNQMVPAADKIVKKYRGRLHVCGECNLARKSIYLVGCGCYCLSHLMKGIWLDQDNLCSRNRRFAIEAWQWGWFEHLWVFSPLYKVEVYLLAYMDSINIILLESEWCVPDELINVNIFTPLVDTKLGKKKKV